MSKTTKRIVKALWAPYMVERTTSRGVDVLVPRYGDRGQEVELLEHDEVRLDELGALEPRGAKAGTQPVATDDEDEDEVEVLDVAASSVVQISEWLTSVEPTVPQTLELAQGNAELAEKLLEAETVATGGEPRKGVEKELQKLIDAAASE